MRDTGLVFWNKTRVDFSTLFPIVSNTFERYAQCFARICQIALALNLNWRIKLERNHLDPFRNVAVCTNLFNEKK